MDLIQLKISSSEGVLPVQNPIYIFYICQYS